MYKGKRQQALMMRSFLGACLLLCGAALTGCSSSAPVTLSITPTAPQTVLAGKTVLLQATVSRGGIVWTLKGTGTLSGASLQPVPANSTETISDNTYQAPSPITASSTATVTASSSVDPSVSQTVTINLSGLTFTTASALPGGTVGVPYSQTVSATGGSGAGYNFTLVSGSLPAGLTLTTAGVLSGTPTASGQFSFTLEVTDSSGESTTQAFTLAIAIPPLTITSSTTASGEVGLSFSFSNTATGGTTPYTWALAAGSNALPAGLTLSSSGVISGTPSTAGVTTVTVMVTDANGNTATQSLTITITANPGINNSEFSGQYAFSLSGFDASGNPLVYIGKLTADGAGNISSGIVDINDTSFTAPEAAVPLVASAYSLGAGNLGTLTLTTSAGSSTFVFTLNQPVSGVSPSGFLTEFDASGQSLTGPITLQDTTAFSAASLTGGYAFGVSGFNQSVAGHAGVIGEVQLSGTGAVSSGEVLSSALTQSPVTSTAGTYTVGANGRGTLTLALSGNTSLNLVFYVVSANQLFLASAGAASGGAASALLSGEALAQTATGFSAASLNGTAVGEMSRSVVASASPSVTYGADVQLGVYTFNGAGTFSLTGDDNDAGTHTTINNGGTYTVASNGRVTLSAAAFGGCVDCVSGNGFLYLAVANQGFLLTYDAGVGTGQIASQTVTGATAAAFSGSYIAGTVEPVTQAATYLVATVDANGTGSFTETEDENTDGALAANKAVTGTYTVAANGRVAVSPSDGTTPVIYLVSPTQGYEVDLGAQNPIVVEVTQ